MRFYQLQRQAAHTSITSGKMSEKCELSHILVGI